MFENPYTQMNAQGKVESRPSAVGSQTKPKQKPAPAPQPYVTPTQAEWQGAQQAAQNNQPKPNNPPYPGANVPVYQQQQQQSAPQPYVTPTQAEWQGAQQAAQNNQQRPNAPYPGANVPMWQQQQQRPQQNIPQPYVTPTQAEWQGAQQAAQNAQNAAMNPSGAYPGTAGGLEPWQQERINQGLPPYYTSGDMFPFELLGGGETPQTKKPGGGGKGDQGDDGGGGGGGGGGVPAPEAAAPGVDLESTGVDLPSLIDNVVKANPGGTFKIPPALQKWLSKTGLYGNLLSILKALGINGLGVLGQYGFDTDFQLPQVLANIDLDALMSGLSQADQLSIGMLLESLFDMPAEQQQPATSGSGTATATTGGTGTATAAPI